jgi:hypothetical protein
VPEKQFPETARLCLLDGGKRGYIIFSDGSRGDLVCTQGEALTQIIESANEEKLDDALVDPLTRQVLASSLSAKDLASFQKNLGKKIKNFPKTTTVPNGPLLN